MFIGYLIACLAFKNSRGERVNVLNINDLFLFVSFSHPGNKAFNKEKLSKKHSGFLLVMRALLLPLNELTNSNIRAFSLSSLCFVIIIELDKGWFVLAAGKRGEHLGGCCCAREGSRAKGPTAEGCCCG